MNPAATQLSEAQSAEVQRLSGEFRDLLGISSSSNIEEQTAQIQTMLEGVSAAFSQLATMERLPGSQITMEDVAKYARDPGVQAAHTAFTDRKNDAEALELAAGEKRTAAHEARGTANTTGEVARDKSKASVDAHKAAELARRQADDADDKATKIEAEAEAKSKQARGADGEATKAEEQAKRARDEAASAGNTADAEQGLADGKRDVADKHRVVAEQAKGEAKRLQGAADAAAAKALASRQEADGARDAANNAPEAQKEAMRAAAREAEHKASLDEAAAKQAASEAKQAKEAEHTEAERAASLDREAQSQQEVATRAREHANGLDKTATVKKGVAQGLRSSANKLGGEAEILAKEAAAARGTADNLGSLADEAQKKAAEAKADEEKALKSASQAEDQARTLENEATKAEAEADVAYEAYKAAGSALGGAVEAAKAKAAEEAAKQKSQQKAPATAEGDQSEQARGSTSQTTNRPTDTEIRRDDEILPVVERTSAEPTVAAGGNERPARPDSTPATRETAARIALKARVANWALNASKVAGQHLVSVGISTALREVAGGLVEYLVETHNPTDEAKTAAACALYGSLMLAQAASMVYDERADRATPLSRIGGGGQLGILAASLAAGLATKSLDQLLPSLVKTFVYSSGRDFANTVLPLTTDPKITANPAFVQMANTLPYGVNQALINAWQTFAGTSGAGFVNAIRNNGTDPNTGKPEEAGPGIGAVSSYVTANYAGEVLNMFVETAIKSSIGHTPMPDFKLEAKWPTLQGLGEKFRDDGILRTGAFFGTYAASNAINPSVQRSHIGEQGAGWAESTIGSFYLMAMLLCCAMASKKKPRPGDTEDVPLRRRGPDAV
ncbi:hypothetical protein C0Z18_09190 [Trinickia dabaoshanensis]|uniref:Uncharacterized protein n=1 Tax=Trinickia dabaoshanensis TaxID=564714 RepID=A0A2N7VU80_9BURK|nr:hypothetical protein C0Z18_09190 [Trinickia dabaoshanensis]